MNYTHKAYFLPDGYTWTDLFNARKAWNINPRHTILTAVSGVCAAWGKPLPDDYKFVCDYIMEQVVKADNNEPNYLA